MKVWGLLGGIALVAAACGGSGIEEAEEPTTTPPAVVTPAPSQQPEATATKTAGAEPAVTTGPERPTATPAAGPGEPVSALAEFLAELNDIDKDLVAEQVSLNSAGASPDALARLWRDAAGRVGLMDVPPEADELHRRFLSFTEAFADASESFAAGVGGGNAQEAVEEFLLTTSALGSDATAFGPIQVELTRTVFAGREDAMAAYMVQLQRFDAEVLPVVGRLFEVFGELATDPVAALETLLEVVEDLGSVPDEWARIDPPPLAADLHQRRLELFEDMVSVFGGLRDAIEADVEPPPGFLFELQEVSLRSQLLNVEAGLFTADVLRGLGSAGFALDEAAPLPGGRDLLNGSLEAGWTWTSADPGLRSLFDLPGFLSITSAPDYGLDYLLREPVARDYIIETKLRFNPTSNFEAAGLAVRQDRDHLHNLIRGFCGGCGEDAIFFGSFIEGKFANSQPPVTLPPGTGDVYLRIRHEQGLYSGFYSVDGSTWVLVGSFTEVLTDPLVGIYTGQALLEPVATASFAYYSETALL